MTFAELLKTAALLPFQTFTRFVTLVKDSSLLSILFTMREKNIATHENKTDEVQRLGDMELQEFGALTITSYASGTLALNKSWEMFGKSKYLDSAINFASGVISLYEGTAAASVMDKGVFLGKLIKQTEIDGISVDKIPPYMFEEIFHAVGALNYLDFLRQLKELHTEYKANASLSTKVITIFKAASSVIQGGIHTFQGKAGINGIVRTKDLTLSAASCFGELGVTALKCGSFFADDLRTSLESQNNAVKTRTPGQTEEAVMPTDQTPLMQAQAKA